MAIVETKVLSIGEFLQNSKLSIPEFQRPYKWTVRNVIQLLDDIEKFRGENPYRIGTIVIYKDDHGLHQIVDGQQRTVTFLLITFAIFASGMEVSQNEETTELLEIIKERRFKPCFENTISKKNIRDNYREIDRRMGAIDTAFIEYFLHGCQITYFVIDDISEAFQFFDSQNARGKDLEPHDLLKAFHLRELKVADKDMTEPQVAKLVDSWEAMPTATLAKLFSDFLYRVRGWSKGNSSRYFQKKDTGLFKGITLGKTSPYPYTHIYQIVDRHLRADTQSELETSFPFQLDQTILNGRYFFEMINHYQEVYRNVHKQIDALAPNAVEILKTINNYEGMNRTGDQYVRLLFNCALLHYIDKFGDEHLSKAIEKLFIWAYTIRLTYQSLQLASVDNYVVHEFNVFKIIKEALNKEDIWALELPLITEEYKSDKTKKIRNLFKQMKYYADGN
jgi:hypothetical protein